MRRTAFCAALSVALSATLLGGCTSGPDGDTPEDLSDEIERTSGFIGAGGTFAFGPTNHNGLSGSDLTMYRVKNGAWVLAGEAR